MPITITEALAEIKTIGKRIEKKREFVLGLLGRQDGIKDPLAADGGSAQAIQRERQAIADLERQLMHLRRGIQRANDSTTLAAGDLSMSISDWLVWRREVAPKAKDFLNRIKSGLSQMREQAKRQGVNVVGAGAVAQAPTDIVVNLNETELAKEIEALESTLGNLDGQLSLKNATVGILD